MPEKHCTKCNITKPLILFSKDKDALSGIRCICKSCDKISNNSYRHTKNGVISKIYSSQTSASKKRGHHLPKYTKKELSEWLSKQINFDALYLNWINSGYCKRKTPSVDRINDYKGYSLSNITLVTWRENNKRSHSDRKSGINNKNSTAVIQMTMAGDFIAEHYSMAHANRSLFAKQIAISRVCKGELKTTGGYRWMRSLGIPIHNNGFSEINL